MKKTLSVVLLLAMLLSLTACDIFGMLGRNEPAFEKAESDVPSDHKISYGGFDNIDDEDVTIIYKTDGNGNVSVVRPGSSGIIEIPRVDESDVEEPEIQEPAGEPVEADGLVGQWHSASRDGDYIDTTYYSFNADGTFSSSTCEYMYSTSAPELFAGFEEGWHAVPMGYPLSFGTYEVDGSNLILSYTGEEFIETYDEPIVYTITIFAVSDDEIVLGDAWDKDVRNTFVRDEAVRNEGDFITALCDRLNVDMNP